VVEVEHALQGEGQQRQRVGALRLCDQHLNQLWLDVEARHAARVDRGRPGDDIAIGRRRERPHVRRVDAELRHPLEERVDAAGADRDDREGVEALGLGVPSGPHE
jgi:hypothetical protein